MCRMASCIAVLSVNSRFVFTSDFEIEYNWIDFEGNNEIACRSILPALSWNNCRLKYGNNCGACETLRNGI